MAAVQPTSPPFLLKETEIDHRIGTIARLLSYRDKIDMKIHRRIASEWFLPGHGDYYLSYIARRRRDVQFMAISPHYLVVEILGWGEFVSNKHYAIGIDYDSDMLFVNRVNSVDMLHSLRIIKLDELNDVSVVYTDDESVRQRVFGYVFDVVEPRFGIEREGTYRVQGDIVFDVTQLDLLSHVQAWAMHEVYRYIRYLVLDRIAAILTDHGISFDVRPSRVYMRVHGRNEPAVVVVGGADSSRWSKYSRRNMLRLIKMLRDYFNGMECVDGIAHTFCNVDVAVGKVQTRARIDILPVPARGGHVGDVEIVVGEAGDLNVLNMFVHDIAEQFHHLPKTDVIRQVGNHRIELYRVVPVRFAYEPFIKPSVLEPQTLYVAPGDTYVVDDDTLVELIHKEHGQRHVWFRGGRYVLRIGRVSVHPLDAAERNRVALSKIPAI